jgi:transcriptional regulator with XRE-family HTH domain
MSNGLRALRHQRGLTLAQVAERAGITVGALSYIERNQRGGRHTTIEGIAKALEVTPSDAYRLMHEATTARP